MTDPKLPRARSLLLLHAAVLCLISAAPGQAPSSYTPTVTFDVASVRPSPDANSFMVGGHFSADSTTLNITNFEIRNLLAMSYGIRWDQAVGLPNWGPRVMFNVEAKADPSTAPLLAKLTPQQRELEQQHMLQALLADRFKLKAHWETRETLVYNLVAAKQGPKMNSDGSTPPTPEELKNFGTHPIPHLYQRGDGRSGYDFVAHGCTTAEIAEMLSGQFGHPVLDKTGLTAKYDFVLRYHGTRLADRPADDLDPIPPLDQAIEDQLGLKLVTAKGSDQFLVIDHIEKPSEN